MNSLTLVNTDGEIYADSRDVAIAIEVEHSKLLRTIRSYCEILNEAKIGLLNSSLKRSMRIAKVRSVLATSSREKAVI